MSENDAQNYNNMSERTGPQIKPILVGDAVTCSNINIYETIVSPHFFIYDDNVWIKIIVLSELHVMYP